MSNRCISLNLGGVYLEFNIKDLKRKVIGIGVRILSEDMIKSAKEHVEELCGKNKGVSHNVTTPDRPNNSRGITNPQQQRRTSDREEHSKMER